MLEILTALLGKTLNLPAERIADILFKKADDGTATDQIAEDALDKFLEAHAEHIETLKGANDSGKQFDNGYKKGKSEALSALEAQLRKDFSTDSTAQGVDLVRHIVGQAASKGKQPDDDAVKSHPLYVKLEREAKEAADNVRSEYEAKITELETGYAKRERFAKVQEKIQEVFEGLRPVLPTSPAAAATVRREFMNRFSDYDFDIATDGNIIVKTGDGKRVENRHGHAVSLADLVRQEAEARFDFAKQDQKGNAANGNGASGGNGNAGSDGFTAPANMEEFQRRLYDHATTAEDRIKLYDWRKEQQASEG
jgi:hypothetical protein